MACSATQFQERSKLFKRQWSGRQLKCRRSFLTARQGADTDIILRGRPRGWSYIHLGFLFENDTQFRRIETSKLPVGTMAYTVRAE